MEYHEQWPRKRSHDDLQSSKWLISAHKNKPLIKGGHRLEKIYIYIKYFSQKISVGNSHNSIIKW